MLAKCAHYDRVRVTGFFLGGIPGLGKSDKFSLTKQIEPIVLMGIMSKVYGVLKC